MNKHTIMNILDLIDSVGEDEVKKGLSGFSCPLNREIENFIHKNAIEFAKRKLSITDDPFFLKFPSIRLSWFQYQ